jgi:predicted methyltransferase
MQENRFSDRYAQQQVDWYSLKEYENGSVRVHSAPLHGRADEYFNKRLWIKEFEVPMMRIDGNLWMSITPLEVQSMLLPIDRAWGYVGTGGLGMGYYALKCAEKDAVKEIKVWENNKDVVKFFTKSFSHRKGFEKIKIIEEDARMMQDESFSYFFMDIYASQLPNNEPVSMTFGVRSGHSCIT